MRSTLYRSPSWRFFAAWTLGLSTGVLGADFQYFSKGVDYWNEQPPSGGRPTASVPPAKTEKAAGATDPKDTFPWGTYLDPKNKEFFKEGEYTPPEPFMEIVRNPSDENLKMWFAYVDKKNELATKLQARMSDYITRHGNVVPPDQKEKLSHPASAKVTPLDLKRYRLRLYFSSECPHCRKMFGTLSELQDQGFLIEARQIDKGKTLAEGLAFPTAFASAEEMRTKNIQNVPLLLVGDLKRKVVYRLTGYQTANDVLTAMRQQERAQ